ncbi:MAG: DEAD/DEAH box helicase [Oscillospiraceae bacterium]|nr:DEAD/DEAH box helicase [Oscillospiraceae bacterium]
MIAAYCIMGHHSGLPNGGSTLDIADEPTLHGRRKRIVEDCSSYIHELELPVLSPPDKTIRDGFGAAFFIRMLFSTLVDADFLDTEAFFQGAIRNYSQANINTLYIKLMEQINVFINPSLPLSELNFHRTALLKDCLSAAQETDGLFTLTAPTGSGKTIASLAFALSHAAKWNKCRIIYIVPYNTIIEQNAAVFEKLLGADNVLQHHSNIQYDDTSEESSHKRLAVENWDYPIIVTSSVQFFQSLFGSKTSVCRKIHNIANSVLVFDEAQMIPVPYLIPCVRAIRELVDEYNCTAVLATATQSALNQYFNPLKAREIADNFRLIEEDTNVVYFLKEAPDLEKRLRSGERSRELFRKLGAYSISLYLSDFRALYDIGAVERLDEGIFLLLDCYYDENCGVMLSPKGGQALMI